MTTQTPPEGQGVPAGSCGWMALRSGLWVDLAVLGALLVVSVLDADRWPDAYWIILGTGLSKSVSTGIAAYVGCRRTLGRG